VVVEDGDAAAVLARRAMCFTSPPTVWHEGSPVDPAPPAVQPPLPPESADLAPLLVAAGAEPVVEHGVLIGEVLGLEVCRVVDGRLEVGVGKHDREAQRMVHGDESPEGALRAAVRIVHEQRPADLAAERWLRSVVVRRPELVGCGGLAPVAPPLPRGDLRVPQPASAVGDGVVVACSVGIDLDLVPTAADTRMAHAPDAALVLVVPEGDDHAVTRALAAALCDPAEVRTVPAAWRSL
jgi:hypothetical protein